MLASNCLAAGEGWMSSYKAANAAAESSGQPLLIHFHAWYCGPCQMMDRQVFSRGDVQEQLSDGLVSVEIDTTRQPDLAQQFGATSVPRDVVVFPNGTVETLNIGAMSHSSYIQMLRRVVDRWQAMAPSSDAEEPETDVPGLPPELVDVDEPETPVGLEGYCPVRLHADRVWLKGDPELTESYRGIVYHFSGQEERSEFLKNPSRFAPQNLGCDPVILLSRQQAVTGKIRFGAFFEDRLYLFESLQSKTTFKSDPRRYSRIQHAIKPADLNGQRFH